ncbi:MAG: MMPL family transporter [Actinomycetota bacterium]|nr:MMPL family transporter [Actinomycetota bacterium]
MRSVAGIAKWSARRPWRAIALWLAFVVVVAAIGVATGIKSLQNGAVGESARGYELIDEHQTYGPAREYGYLHSDTLATRERAFRDAVADVAARMAGDLGNIKIRTSRDRHAALVVGQWTHPFAVDELRASVLAAGKAHPQVTIEETGDISAGDARDRVVSSDLRRAELLSVPVTLFVLLFAFGAVVAALVPVLLALTAVAAAFGLLGPISQVFPLDDATKTVVLLIGMAVGVDYALFYVIRSRQERRRGLHSHDALEVTARTSGRTVIVSGTTVAIAMAGMYIIGSKIFNGIASGTIAVIVCAVAGSVTVLPAVLELLGSKIDRGRIPFLPHLHTDSSQSRFWPAVIDRVLRRPVLSCVLSGTLLVALALPALGLHVSKPSDNALSAQNEPTVATFARIRADFPATSEPAIVVVAGPPEQRAAAERALARLQSLAVARGVAHPPFTVNGSNDGRAASLELPLTGAGDNAASKRSLEILRRELVPATLGRMSGVETAVTGATAEDVDFTRQMKHGVPYVIAFVLVFAYLLLLFAFRSIVVPLKAIVLNLLSVGASYGVLALVFQHHWAESLLGFRSDGAIIAWLPLFLFVVLFGLSMDYHVFILSRVREAVDGGMATSDAVRHGITVTAGVVTSAALVMVGVFALFGSLTSLDVKQAGVGLAVAVLLDATVIRAVLLPASMELLGEWNWYLPRFLERLPKMRLEGPAARDPV